MKQAAHLQHLLPLKMNQLLERARQLRRTFHKYWSQMIPKVGYLNQNQFQINLRNIRFMSPIFDTIFFFLIPEVSEFADDNASTTETDENKVLEEIEDMEDEEGIDGVSSEGEKTSGGTETVEVWSLFTIIFSNSQ